MIHIGFVGAQCRPLVEKLAAAGTPLAWCAPDAHGERGVACLDNAVLLAQALAAPRVVWLRLPDGFATELAIQDVWPELDPGDVVVDAGSGAATDGRRRAASLASARIGFVDCGMADGALFLGGETEAIRIVAPYAGTIAGEAGWMHCGPAGAGYRA
jgi:6-phosphogluconate dehydrogenase